MHDLRPQLFSFDFEKPDGDRQTEAARAARTRIEIEHASLVNEIRDVGVTVEDSGEFGRSGVEVQGVQIVQQVEITIAGQRDLCLGKLRALAAGVNVAAHRDHGRNLLKLSQDGDFANVAEVENLLDALEGRQNLRPQQAVSVADDADLHSCCDARSRRATLRALPDS